MKAWFGSPSPQPDHSLAEIDEELLFHLRSRVEDNQAAGMNEDDAWDDARRRLGSYRSNLEECHVVRFGTGRSRVAGMVAVATLLIAGGWLATDWRAKGLMAQQGEIKQQLGALTNAVHQTAAVAAAIAEAGSQNLEVLVTDKGQPVKDAEVLLILKTWPNNRYRQDPYHAKTGDDGTAKFDKLIPAEGQFAIHAAVVHSGHTLTSAYHLFEAGQRDLKAIKPLQVALGKAQKFRFQLQDAEGKPLASAHVAPASRKAGLDEFQLYFDASGPATVAANADGEVTLDCFARGDEAKLFVTPLGRRATEATCTIPKDGDVVTVVVPAPQRSE